MAKLDELASEVALLREMVLHGANDDVMLSPAQVRERTTLSDTEIRRRQDAGSFPPWVPLGLSKRGMPRSWVLRWMRATVRGEAWTREDSEACLSMSAGMVA